MTGIQSKRKIITLDCREMAPPEPLVKVLETLNTLAHDEALLMIHRKRPNLLFPRLDELGFSHEIKEEDESVIKLLIWKGD